MFYAYRARLPNGHARLMGLGTVALLAVGSIVLRRRSTARHDRDCSIALSRVRSQQHYLAQMPRLKKRTKPKLPAEPISYSLPEPTEVSSFEQLMDLPDGSLRSLLMRIEPAIIALALRTASEELQRRIFRALPADRRRVLQDHPDFSAPARLSDIEAAQQEMLDLLESPEDTAAELVGSSAISDT